MPKKQNWHSISFFHLAHLLAVLVGSWSMAKGVILSCLFVTVMFCCTGYAWACGVALLLGAAEAASSESPIFYLCFSSLLFLSRPHRQCSDRVRQRKTSTRVHSQM